ncbi:MAG: glycosyltransferase family 39 protein [Candidatus Eisenbacteria bacterium]|nr:glycosyltransferase family 39 protein [Candidatus Eisenbacteria bacterium]
MKKMTRAGLKAKPLEPAARAPLSRRGRPSIALLAVLLVGAALRLQRLGHGLPDFLEEAIPFRRALEMWGWQTGAPDWNPHFFHYPSLSIYVHHVLQRLHYALGMLLGQFSSPADYALSYNIDPTTHVLVARALGVLCDLATVVGAARIAAILAPRISTWAAALVAVAPTLIATSTQIFSDTPATALAVWSLERTLTWRRDGGRVRFVAAAALAGLAAGTKYPAALLAIPLAAAIVLKHGARPVRHLAVAATIFAAAFLLATPYALLDFGVFREHVLYELRHASTGHFGQSHGMALPVQMRLLSANLTVLGVPLLGLSLLATVRHRRARPERVIIWSCLLPLLAATLAARIAADRYSVPIIALGAPLALAAGHEVLGRFPGARVTTRLFGPLMVLWAGWASFAHSGHRPVDTQVIARMWCEEHLGGDGVMLVEAYGPVLLDDSQRSEILHSRVFAEASAALQQRFLARPHLRAVSMPLSVSGRVITSLPGPDGHPVEATVFTDATDLNNLFYDPRLLNGVDVVVTSSSVRDRFAAEPERFRPALGFYARLDRAANLVARFRTGGSDTTGPTITVYRLGQARSDRSPLEPLPLSWWTERIPETYQRAATALLGATPLPRPNPATACPDSVSPWVLGLRSFYRGRISPFSDDLATQLLFAGRYEAARRLSAATLAMDPMDVMAFRAYAVASFGLESWPEATRQLEGFASALDSLGYDSAPLKQDLGRLKARYP